MAAAYGQRPSTILGISDEWAAYSLDAAVLVIGRRAEAGTASSGKGSNPAPGRKRMGWREMASKLKRR